MKRRAGEEENKLTAENTEIPQRAPRKMKSVERSGAQLKGGADRRTWRWDGAALLALSGILLKTWWIPLGVVGRLCSRI